MLQTRFETEQFDTLPLIFPSHRSRNDYITTDRPDSAQVFPFSFNPYFSMFLVGGFTYLYYPEIDLEECSTFSTE